MNTRSFNIMPTKVRSSIKITWAVQKLTSNWLVYTNLLQYQYGSCAVATSIIYIVTHKSMAHFYYSCPSTDWWNVELSLPLLPAVMYLLLFFQTAYHLLSLFCIVPWTAEVFNDELLYPWKNEIKITSYCWEFVRSCLNDLV